MKKVSHAETRMSCIFTLIFILVSSIIQGAGCSLSSLERIMYQKCPLIIDLVVAAHVQSFKLRQNRPLNVKK